MSTSFLQQSDMNAAHNEHLDEQEFGNNCGSEENSNKEDKEHNYKHYNVSDDIVDGDVNDVEEIHREVLNAKASSQLHEFTKFREFPPEIREVIWNLAINTTFTEAHENDRHLTLFEFPKEEVIWSCKLMLTHAHTSSEARQIVARKLFRYGGHEYKYLTEETVDGCIFPVVSEITLRKVDDVISCSDSLDFAAMCIGVCIGSLSDERKEENAKHLQKLLEA